LKGAMEFSYATGDIPGMDELLALYDSVGWTAYTRDPLTLFNAVSASLAVITARVDGQLVGLARIIGDGYTVSYLQDILVHPHFQRCGIGRGLFRRAFDQFDVRQRVLVTDDEPRQRAFYEAMGFTEARNLQHPLRTFVRFG
jgi:Acetyltransferases